MKFAAGPKGPTPSQAGLKALFVAIAKGNLPTVKRLLPQCGGIEVRGKTQWMKGNPVAWTPLLAAVESNQMAVAQYLIAQGSDVNAQVLENPYDNFRGASALMIASAQGNLKLINLLIKAGANVNARCKSVPWTPLVYAVTHQQSDAADALLKAGGLFHATDTDFILGKAMLFEGPSLFVRLVRAANVRLKDKPGLLRYAAERGNLEIVKVITEAGVDVDAISAENRADRFSNQTALMAACMKRHQTVVEFLLQSGANPAIEINQVTALEWARRTQHSEIIKILENALRTQAPVPAKADPLPVQAHTKVQKPMSARAVANLLAKHRSGRPGDASSFIKAMHAGHPEWSLLAVKAPLDATAKACMKMWNCSRRIEHLRAARPTRKPQQVDQNPVVVHVKDHNWTIAFRSLYQLVDDVLKVDEAAQQISKDLKTQVISFISEDTSGVVGGRWYDRGALVKEFGSDEDGATPSIILFRELGILLPSCYPMTDKGQPKLAVSFPDTAQIERGDLLLP